VGASDRFEGYAAERTDLLRFIDQNGIQNVVFVAADVHGTVVNNLTYQDFPFGPQVPTGAFEITTGAVAYDAPFGPTVIDIAERAGFIDAPTRAFYDSLPVAPDANDLPNDKDDFLKGLINSQITSPPPAGLGYDPVGLKGSSIAATLLQGDYIAVHTFGWTEFRINRQTQRLRVTTYGIAPYTEAELIADPQAITNRVPEVVSQFVVDPVR
ncbi:MAG: alkaline phosphatase D family protein, partial [Pyrinomonadaceae bacterium]|nr:alkaline phosphatase D family protein [Pyrinomonadaceae bacterium]